MKIYMFSSMTNHSHCWERKTHTHKVNPNFCSNYQKLLDTTFHFYHDSNCRETDWDESSP